MSRSDMCYFQMEDLRARHESSHPFSTGRGTVKTVVTQNPRHLGAWDEEERSPTTMEEEKE